jgi:hypothetical protein
MGCRTPNPVYHTQIFWIYQFRDCHEHYGFCNEILDAGLLDLTSLWPMVQKGSGSFSTAF